MILLLKQLGRQLANPFIFCMNGFLNFLYLPFPGERKFFDLVSRFWLTGVIIILSITDLKVVFIVLQITRMLLEALRQTGFQEHSQKSDRHQHHGGGRRPLFLSSDIHKLHMYDPEEVPLLNTHVHLRGPCTNTSEGVGTGTPGGRLGKDRDGVRRRSATAAMAPAEAAAEEEPARAEQGKGQKQHCCQESSSPPPL